MGIGGQGTRCRRLTAGAASRRAVFLDRDGVLNAVVLREGQPYPPAQASELRILPGVAEALARLREKGFLLIVATNQPDVGAGRQDRATVEAMHAHLRQMLPLDDIRVCWNRDDPCYKPRPGLLQAAAADWAIHLADSFMVGDRWRDIGAGQAAGCHTILVGTGYGEPMPVAPEACFPSLLDCVPYIMQFA